MHHHSCCQPHSVTISLTIVVLAALAGCQHVKQLTSRTDSSSQATARRTSSSFAPVVTGRGRSKPAHKTKSDAAFAAARKVERAGEFDKASAAYEEILKQQPGFAAAHHRLAIVYEQMGRESLAQQHFESAVKLAPDNSELLCDYGYSRYLRGDLERAEGKFQAALALQPSLQQAHLNLGLIQARTGREREALESFRAAGCNNSESRSNLAYGLMKEDKWPQAAQHLQVALSQDPESRMLQKRMQEVRAVMSTPQKLSPEISPVALNEGLPMFDSEPAAMRSIVLPSPPATDNSGNKDFIPPTAIAGSQQIRAGEVSRRPIPAFTTEQSNRVFAGYSYTPTDQAEVLGQAPSTSRPANNLGAGNPLFEITAVDSSAVPVAVASYSDSQDGDIFATLIDANATELRKVQLRRLPE